MDWRDDFKSSLRRLKRIIFIRWGRFMRSASNNTKLKRPQNLSKSEDTALQIFLEILHDIDSKLNYDITTQECYISSPDKKIFIWRNTLTSQVAI